tara:strand:+ start:156 stop:323 length:168 start_codon:yes stop_codon:yes gene_type:complete
MNYEQTHIAVNHNGVHLCKPTTERIAKETAYDYTWATGNCAKVIRVVDAVFREVA